MDRAWVTIDGNEAAANVAYRLAEVIAIYPITPSTPMGELADAWSAAAAAEPLGCRAARHRDAVGGRRGGRDARRAAGRRAGDDLHRVAGAAADDPQYVQDRGRADAGRSFTSPRARWPPRRSRSSAITQDVMAARATGFALLASNSVQEAQDLALIAHAATLAGARPVPALLRRLPHLARDRQDRAARRRRSARHDR